MTYSFLRAVLAVTLFAGALVGCTKPVVREKQIADPLLVSKKPVEGKPHLAPARPPANDDVPPPPPPPMPPGLLAPRLAGR